MDFRLKAYRNAPAKIANSSFNPCSNGLSAQRGCDGTGAALVNIVSILVLMDFRLKVSVFPILASVEAEFQSLF